MKKAKTKSLNFKFLVMMIITGLFISFIWLHSMMNASDSTKESMGVVGILNVILSRLGFSQSLTDHIVRKSAHFCEFAVLGVLTSSCALAFNGKIFQKLMQIGFVCLFVGVIDEYIQLFSEGRSAQITDVLLDFYGSVVGVVFFAFAVFIVRIVKKRGK